MRMLLVGLGVGVVLGGLAISAYVYYVLRDMFRGC